MHLRAVDDHLREYEHKKVLGYNDEREARSPHDCRRTYASLEYLNGTDVFVLMRQLGRANVSQTWDYIKDVAEASERRSQLKGSGLLLEAPKQPESPNFAVDAENSKIKKPETLYLSTFLAFPIERETVLSASGACLARTEKLARASRRREQIPKESLRARSAL